MNGIRRWEERHRRLCILAGLLAVAALAVSPGAAAAANDAETLAKKLQNPVASLISVPLQNNWDLDAGSDDQGWRYTLNLQPVIPISLTEDWNLISRTILPIVHQDDVIGDDTQSGLGDTTQSLFFSPSKPGPLSAIWGVGPVVLLPTATDNVLGTQKWGAGPTAVVLRQSSGWTYGVLANHIWSFAGSSHRENVSSTFLQPFLSYTFKSATSLLLNTESTYDWRHSQWTIPLHAGPSQVLKLGDHVFSRAAQGRYYAEGPDTAPDWGARFVLTLLFPKQ